MLIIVVFIIGFIIYFKHFKSTTKVDNIKKEENQNLIKNESNNQIIIDELIEAEAPMPSGQGND